jgi:hypothetical protein
MKIDGRKILTYLILNYQNQVVGQIYGRFKNEAQVIDEWVKRAGALSAIQPGPYKVSIYVDTALDNYGVSRGG